MDASMAMRWRVTAVRRDQALPGSAHSNSGGGGYLCEHQTSHRNHHWADTAHYINVEQMGERKHGLSLLCCEHIGIMTVHVGGNVCVCVLVLFRLRLSSFSVIILLLQKPAV